MISAISSTTAADRTVADRTAAARRLRRGVSSAIILASFLALPSMARAGDATPADQLFKEGRALLDAKRYDDACPKLAESQKREPGAGTLLALALCHEGQGKTATAWSDLNDAAALGKRVGRNDLAAAAQKRAAVLEPTLPHLVVRTREGGADYDVKCDGAPFESKQLGTPVPVDPGEHRIDVSARGKVARNYTVVLSGAGTVEIVVDKLEDAPAQVAVAPVTKTDSVRLAVESPGPVIADHQESTGGAQRAVGLGLVGVGIVGLGVGAYFGGKALSESAEGRRECTSSPCPANANEANEHAKSSMTGSIVGVAAGTGAIALGLIVYMLAPSATVRGTGPTTHMTARLTPEIGPTQASLGVSGAF
jgi:hypothetical protein